MGKSQVDQLQLLYNFENSPSLDENLLNKSAEELNFILDNNNKQTLLLNRSIV